MKTCYRVAVEHYRAHPEETAYAWQRPYLHPQGCLFKLLSPDAGPHALRNGQVVGDPLQVKHSMGTGRYVAWGIGLTDRIVRSALPKSVKGIEEKHVIWLARLQDELDRTLRNREWQQEHAYEPLISPSLWAVPWEDEE